MAPHDEFTSAISEIAEEKGIPPEKVTETIAAAIAAAYRRDYGRRGQDIRATFDAKTGKARIFKVVTVTEPVLPAEGGEPRLQNPDAEFTVEEARKHKPDAVVSEEIFFEVTPTDPHYGRIAAQTAKQVIIQRIREAERQATFDAFKGKENEILNGTVQRVENGNVFVDLGRATGILFPSEQVPSEHYRVNQRLKVFIIKVDLTSRGTDIILSRSHPGMLKKLFELEVPEVYGGIVEIKAVAREAGVRSKVAVVSHQEGVDAVGSCIGQRGTRIQTIISELSGEKIDIIQWDEDPVRFAAHALSPAKVIAVDLREEERKAIVHVNEDQLSLAIGKRGQNVRLAAKLTGWRIDIVKTGVSEVVEGSSDVPGAEKEGGAPESAGGGAPETPEAVKQEEKEVPSEPSLAGAAGTEGGKETPREGTPPERASQENTTNDS